MKANLLRALFLAALSASATAPSCVRAGDRTPRDLEGVAGVHDKCHKKEHRGIYQQWGASKHYRANVGCYECHAAEKSDKDAIQSL